MDLCGDRRGAVVTTLRAHHRWLELALDWDIVLPRLAGVLSPGGMLALFDDQTLTPPWQAQLGQIIPRFSTNRDFQPYNLIEELVRRGLFRVMGSRQTKPVGFCQTISGYVESFHSRNGFSRQRMKRRAAEEFDSALREVVTPHAREDGMLELQLLSTVTWGKPLG